MADATLISSRRGLLGRALTLAAGALGAGVAGRAAGAAPAPSTHALVLSGRGFHLHSPTAEPGVPPAKGEHRTGYGELVAASGAVAGHFTSAFLAFDSPFGAAGSLELQTFHLEDGTIHGLGSVATGSEGHFAILGGTGVYSGARGSYVARQYPRELGGDGTAEFQLTIASEGGNGGR